MARPPQFDCNQVLDKATKLFWEKGYRSVSVTDLVKATGLLPGSLYARFGNKEGIFVACLQHYGAWAERLRGEFETIPSPLERVRTFVLAMARQAAGNEGHRGCFLVSASQECCEDEVGIVNEINAHFSAGEVWLGQQLEAAVEAGELPSDFDVATTVTCLQSALSGFRVIARSGRGSDRIPEAAATLLDALLHRVKTA